LCIKVDGDVRVVLSEEMVVDVLREVGLLQQRVGE
jgi:hypothetical protein